MLLLSAVSSLNLTCFLFPAQGEISDSGRVQIHGSCSCSRSTASAIFVFRCRHCAVTLFFLPAGGDVSPVPIRSSSTLPTPQPGSAPSTPTNTSHKTSCTSTTNAEEEELERGDLIHFYNNVYIKQMTPFALKYSPNSLSAGVRGLSWEPFS